MSKISNNVLVIVLPVVAALFLIQAVPYGRNLKNPPIISEPAWDNVQTRALAKRACFDCHSHETVRPWYSRIAPMSWLAQYDVENGRRELNFSDWKNGARSAEHAGKMLEEISEDEMPPIAYRLAHPEARLQDAEKRMLIEGLKATATPR
jgi:mono/diheme cytochrome c family protein